MFRQLRHTVAPSQVAAHMVEQLGKAAIRSFHFEQGLPAACKSPVSIARQSRKRRAKAVFAASAQDTLRVGNEAHVQTLDDRWPGAPLGMMFDHVNINHGSRTQLETFVEWERRWNSEWTTQFGVRNDTIWMNTGVAQGYDGVDPTAAAFNAGARSHTDVNVDATWLNGFEPNDQETYSIGFAVINLLDRQYSNPLGGTWQSALYSPGYAGATFRPLPAQGRSLDACITLKF